MHNIFKYLDDLTVLFVVPHLTRLRYSIFDIYCPVSKRKREEKIEGGADVSTRAVEHRSLSQGLDHVFHSSID